MSDYQMFILPVVVKKLRISDQTLNMYYHLLAHSGFMLFVGRLMSYSRYLCLLANSGVQYYLYLN
jgi:hypothetical protein